MRKPWVLAPLKVHHFCGEISHVQKWGDIRTPPHPVSSPCGKVLFCVLLAQVSFSVWRLRVHGRNISPSRLHSPAGAASAATVSADPYSTPQQAELFASYCRFESGNYLRRLLVQP